MEYLFEVIVYFFFYTTGYALTWILTLGRLRPEKINWYARRKWKFAGLVHTENQQNYLNLEWVTLLGVCFWLVLAFVIAAL